MLVTTYTGGGIVPALDPEYGLSVAIQVLPAGAGTTKAFPQGCLLAESVANPGQFSLYDDTNTDLNVAKGVNIFPFVVNDAGQVIFGSGQTLNQFGVVYGSAMMFIRGYFNTADLYQTAGPGAIDAAAVADFGRLINGTIASGILAVR